MAIISQPASGVPKLSDKQLHTVCEGVSRDGFVQNRGPVGCRARRTVDPRANGHLHVVLPQRACSHSGRPSLELCLQCLGGRIVVAPGGPLGRQDRWERARDRQQVKRQHTQRPLLGLGGIDHGGTLPESRVRWGPIQVGCEDAESGLPRYHRF